MNDLIKLWIVGALTFTLVIAELVMGHFSHCLTLLAVTNQSLYNLLLVIVAIVGAKLESRKKSLNSVNQPDLKSTFGWARIEVVGSLSCLVFLASLCFATTIECLQTLFHSDHLDAMHQPFWVCVVGFSHLIIWAATFILIGGYSYAFSIKIKPPNRLRSSRSGNCMSLKAKRADSLVPEEEVELRPIGALKATKDDDIVIPKTFMEKMRTIPVKHFPRDLTGCLLLIVLTATAYILEDGFQVHIQFADPIIALLIIVILIATSYGIFKESGLILLQTIPAELDVESFKKELLKKFQPAIVNIHEMHVWCLVPSEVVVTTHVVFRSERSYSETYTEMEKYFVGSGVTKYTIQPEFMTETLRSDPSLVKEKTCLLRCKKGCKGCCN